MAGVLPGEAFPFEDVAQVTATVGTDYFRTMPVGVHMALHASRVFIIETRPAAARLELSLRGIERVVAASADKGAGRKLRLILARERSFRSLVKDDSLFV